MIAAYNKRPDAPIALRLAVPSEFEAVAAKRADRPVFKGELNPIFQGTYSSRIELKRWMRDLERKLVAAEKLAVVTGWLGGHERRDGLMRAWEPVMFNETHDLASGVMTDQVYEDTIRSYEYSGRLADELIAKPWETLAAKVDTKGEGVPVLVYNPLGWARSDLVEIDAGPSGAKVAGLAVLDPEGKEVPSQAIEATRFDDGGLRIGADRLRGA